MTIFPLVFATIFIAEMGDKTQLLLIAMTSKYKVRDILLGTWAATAVLNLLAVGVGAALANYLDMRIIKSIAAIAFFWFAYSTLKGDDGDEDEEELKGAGRTALIVIFTSFFIGELGDKTQLSGIALAAAYTNHSMINAVYVFLGCTLGLIAADFLGLIVGLVFKSKLPESLLNKISFAIFAVFGVLNSYEAGQYIFGKATIEPVITTAIVTAIFILLCVACVMKKQQKELADGKKA